MIVLQTLRHRRPPRQPLRPTRLHFRFFPYRTFQARSADAYISSGRTGRPYRPTSGSSLSYGTATFYPLIPRRHSPRIHPVYPTLLLTRSSRTCLTTYSYFWTSGLSRRFHARPQVSTAGSSSHPRNQATGGPSSTSAPSTGFYALHTSAWRRPPLSCVLYSQVTGPPRWTSRTPSFTSQLHPHIDVTSASGSVTATSGSGPSLSAWRRHRTSSPA